MTERERLDVTAQERRDLEADIRELRQHIRLERAKWADASEVPPDRAIVIERWEAELHDLRLQRRDMDQPAALASQLDQITGAQIAALQRAVNLLSAEVAGFRKTARWVVVLGVAMAFQFGGFLAFLIYAFTR